MCKPVHASLWRALAFLGATNCIEYLHTFSSTSASVHWRCSIAKLDAGQTVHATDRLTSEAPDENGDIHTFSHPTL